MTLPRDRCVEFILELARGFERLSAANERLEQRVRRLEEQSREDSRTSSKPPSADPPKTRQQRRAQARAKAKELLANGDVGATYTALQAVCGDLLGPSARERAA